MNELGAWLRDSSYLVYTGARMRVSLKRGRRERVVRGEILLRQITLATCLGRREKMRSVSLYGCKRRSRELALSLSLSLSLTHSLKRIGEAYFQRQVVSD